MFLKKSLQLDALFFVIVGAFMGLYLVTYVKSQPVQFHSNAAAPLTNVLPSTATPTNSVPSPTPTVSFEPTATTTSQISSDGSQQVNLKTTQNQDQTKTYEVSTSDGGAVVFNKTLGPNENVTLPFNAWEPQNRYFFIQENLAAGPKVLVFKADGTPFGDGQPYLDLTDAYAKLGSSYTYDAATGWAGYNLIVINTKNADGSQGSSYWYELPYGSLVPLATKF